MPVFPTRQRITTYKHIPAAKFDAPRSDSRGERKHGACDIYAPIYTAVLAPEDGIVTLGPYPFYKGTDAIEITFGDWRVCRMGECKFFTHVAKGYKVKAGEPLGWIAPMEGMPQPMLHFELYKGDQQGNLTTNVGPWFRRSDLLDPTGYLDAATVLGSS